jgi:GNAT superfamily N-acetyltransferase
LHICGRSVLAALRTRLATPEDRAAIREVCLSAVGPDDYVLHDIDSWSRTGEISLAEDGAGGVLGIIRTIDLPDGSAWLGSIRTVKGAQRRGVATELTGAAMARAKRRGMTRARMLISSKNTPSLGVAAKSGFDEVFRAAVLEKGEEGADPEDVIRKTRPGPPAARGAGLYFHPTGSPEALVALAKPLGRGELTESPIIRGLRGFAGLFFMFVSAENEVLERCAPRTVPVFVDGERFIFTANRTEPWHALQPLTHGPGVAKAAVRALEIGGVGEGLVYLPMDERFHRAYIEAGFEYSKWAREAVVLERLL